MLDYIREKLGLSPEPSPPALSSLLTHAVPILSTIGEPAKVAEDTKWASYLNISVLNIPGSTVVALTNSNATNSAQAAPQIIGAGSSEAHVRINANIYELCENVVRIRANFKIIGAELDQFDEKGFAPIKLTLAHVLGSSQPSLGAQWRMMSDVSSYACS
jgi:hypothetical protein